MCIPNISVTKYFEMFISAVSLFMRTDLEMFISAVSLFMRTDLEMFISAVSLFMRTDLQRKDYRLHEWPRGGGR
jgi:hypothetical protein